MWSIISLNIILKKKFSSERCIVRLATSYPNGYEATAVQLHKEEKNRWENENFNKTKYKQQTMNANNRIDTRFRSACSLHWWWLWLMGAGESRRICPDHNHKFNFIMETFWLDEKKKIFAQSCKFSQWNWFSRFQRQRIKYEDVLAVVLAGN